MLVILIEESRIMGVGSLGDLKFESGLYAYVGSAQNNLEKRVARHFRRNKRIFWHIDYLLNDGHAKILEVFFKVAAKIEECKVAEAIGEVNEPIFGFGSSDCRCASHLFKVVDYEGLRSLLTRMGFAKLDLEALSCGGHLRD